MTTNEPPTIIAFASPKGGAGKSTTCLNIAGALCARGYKVHVIDFDQSETLWRWYSDSEKARSIENLTIEKAPKADLDVFVKKIWHHEADFVLIDLAGQLTREMLHMAVFADITITPTKLSEPDIVEAQKLYDQLCQIQTKVHKPIIHRLLINGALPLLAGYEYALLDQLMASELPRFATIVRHRAPYGEIFMTGQPPHMADRTRQPVIKAVAELDDLTNEILALLAEEEGTTQEKEAA